MNEPSGAATQNGVSGASVLADLKRSEQALQSAFQELEQTKEQLRLAIDSIPGLVWTALPDGRVEFLNARFLEYIGLKPEQVAGWGWHEAIHPEDLPGLMKTWGEVLASGKPGDVETRIKRFDGDYRWFLSRGVPLYDKQGKVIRWYGLDTDIQDRKQAEALLFGENRLLEMVARGDSLQLLLDALCQLVEAITSGALCSILLVDSGGKQLVFGAAPSLPSSYTEMIGGCAIGPSSAPCGLAAFLGQPVIASDIESETRWPEYRVLALAHGMRACWSTPILSREGKVLGSFAVISREPGSPSPYQEGLIQQFTHIASIAIERTQSEDALNQLRAELAHVARVTTLGELTASIAHEVNQPLAADGARLAVVLFPLAYQLDPDYPYLPQHRIAAYCQTQGIPCIDLLEVFRKQPAAKVFQLDAAGYHDIWHLTRAGHRLTAEALAGFLAERRLLDSP